MFRLVLAQVRPQPLLLVPWVGELYVLVLEMLCPLLHWLHGELVLPPLPRVISVVDRLPLSPRFPKLLRLLPPHPPLLCLFPVMTTA